MTYDSHNFQKSLFAGNFFNIMLPCSEQFISADLLFFSRYMMLILKEKEIYLIDRDNNVFAAPQFHFPQRKFPREHVFDTLLDGVSPSCLFLKESEWTDLILSCSDHELHLVS